MRRIVAALCLSIAAAGNASATDLAFSRGLAQGDFKSLVEDAGSALSYKNLAPASPLGLLGFDIGAEMTVMKLSGSYWDAAMSGNAPSALVVPKLRARKGLPFSMDVGLMYSMIPQSNVQLIGAELSEAVLDGGVILPAIGIRATYTRLLGVSSMDFQTAGLDASISKSFLFLTPYAGAGLLWMDGQAKGKVVTDPAFIAANGGSPLQEERVWGKRFFGGLKVTPIPLLGITAEVEYSGLMTYSLRVGLGF